MYYAGEKIRLLRDVPESGLAEGALCDVADAGAGEEAGASLELEWYSGSQTHTATVPIDAVEPVLSAATEQRTAVLWGLETPPESLIEAVIHAMLDRGLVLSAGLNVAPMHYDAQQRWWKREEPISDPAGAGVATSGHQWDGCVVSFNSEERFHLEFRLQGRGEAALLLHERDSAYSEQVRGVSEATELTTVLMDLSSAAIAQYCAFPVASPWMMDEDWASLLRPPYYPDIFLLPEAKVLQELPREFRTAGLSHGRSMAAAFPVKFSPHDHPRLPNTRDLMLGSLRQSKSLGEKYYDQLYETHLGATGLYSSAKESFYDAISIANRMGLKEEAEALERRLQHIKEVFRSQFT